MGGSKGGSSWEDSGWVIMGGSRVGNSGVI